MKHKRTRKPLCYFVRFEASHSKNLYQGYSGHRFVWFDKKPKFAELINEVVRSAKDCDLCKGDSENWNIFIISFNRLDVLPD